MQYWPILWKFGGKELTDLVACEPDSSCFSGSIFAIHTLQIHRQTTCNFPKDTLRIEANFAAACLEVPLHALKFSQSYADGFPFPVHSGTYMMEL